MAEAAGVSLAVEHYHVKNKEELLTEIMAESRSSPTAESMRPAFTRLLGTAEMRGQRGTS
ncbi:hypothetical protein I1A62_02825 (plasmid) [Rhodococcus sp. USK10]|uniref:hypothetical protein n=1 Tax=Rhodococcus sp. USK10 TaxID=2789739 RepID=UPI001C5D62C9|nr:hypothetical protein [Rhodococcus sp. USK10]QYB00060.1 hypothetical protein I1A62_02825 [Rhodococcus sp. USK10]